MNASEILRKLADVIDSQETGSSKLVAQQVPHQDQSAQLHAVEIDNHDHTESNLMVPPLQQKLELMKKLAGEDESCKECGCEPCECEPDELSIMRQNAGIAPAIIAIADEDEPFEG